jgi:hypothetical protein
MLAACYTTEQLGRNPAIRSRPNPLPQILELKAQKLKDPEIADRLGLTYRQVIYHLHRWRCSLGTNRRNQKK